MENIIHTIIPWHVIPSLLRVNPCEQPQEYEPSVLMQISEQICLPSKHSSISKFKNPWL